MIQVTITGVAGAGKTAVAQVIEQELSRLGAVVTVHDPDQSTPSWKLVADNRKKILDHRLVQIRVKTVKHKPR